MTLEERAGDLNTRRVAKGCASDIQWCRWIVQADLARTAYLARYKQMIDDQRKILDEAQEELARLDLLSAVAEWRSKYNAEPTDDDLKAIVEGYRP